MRFNLGRLIALPTQPIAVSSIVIVGMLGCAGCGQKGALYLPESQPVVNSDTDGSTGQTESPIDAEQIQQIITDPNDY